MNPIPPGWRFEIDRQDFTRARWVEAPDIGQLSLHDGEVLLKVDRFGFTANNITYAIYGDEVGYWRFFEGSPGWGIIPVWGYADVVSSSCAGIAPGERMFGYLPMAEFLVIRPERIGQSAFSDGAPNRAALPPTYNEYRRANADPRHAAPFEAHQMLLKPLLTLSWLVADMLTEVANFDAEQIVITGASSRTALGLTKALRELQPTVRIIGVTSAANQAFAERRGVYDCVVDYHAINPIPYAATCIVDISGNHEALGTLHDHLAGVLKRSVRVGDTAQSGSAARDLRGPQPVLFFAPDNIRKRRGDWGVAVYQHRFEAAWDMLSAWMASWLHIEEVQGREGVGRVYHAVRRGASPDTAHILKL